MKRLFSFKVLLLGLAFGIFVFGGQAWGAGQFMLQLLELFSMPFIWIEMVYGSTSIARFPAGPLPAFPSIGGSLVNLTPNVENFCHY